MSSTIPTITLCQGAVGLASLSLVLQLAAAIARSRSSTYIDAPAEPSLAPVVLTAVPDPTEEERPSLKLSRAQLLEIARSLGVRNARWRNAARKTDLLAAIRAHNQQRRAA